AASREVTARHQSRNDDCVSCAAGCRHREEEGFSGTCRRPISKATKVLDQVRRVRRIDIFGMRQVMCAHENITTRDGQVLCQLSLDCKIRLVRIGVLKLLVNKEREG